MIFAIGIFIIAISMFLITFYLTWKDITPEEIYAIKLLLFAIAMLGIAQYIWG